MLEGGSMLKGGVILQGRGMLKGRGWTGRGGEPCCSLCIAVPGLCHCSWLMVLSHHPLLPHLSFAYCRYVWLLPLVMCWLQPEGRSQAKPCLEVGLLFPGSAFQNAQAWGLGPGFCTSDISPNLHL